MRCLPEVALDGFFAAAVSATEEAILSSMAHAHTRRTVKGGLCLSLQDALKQAAVT